MTRKTSFYLLDDAGNFAAGCKDCKHATIDGDLEEEKKSRKGDGENPVKPALLCSKVVTLDGSPYRTWSWAPACTEFEGSR